MSSLSSLSSFPASRTFGIGFNDQEREKKTKRLSSYRSAISQPASRRAAAQQSPVRDTTQCKEKDLNFEKLRTIKLIFFLCNFAVPVIYSLETFSYNPGESYFSNFLLPASSNLLPTAIRNLILWTCSSSGSSSFTVLQYDMLCWDGVWRISTIKRTPLSCCFILCNKISFLWAYPVQQQVCLFPLYPALAQYPRHRHLQDVLVIKLHKFMYWT